MPRQDHTLPYPGAEKETLSKLLRQLQARSAETRLSAAAALSKMGPHAVLAVEALMEALQDEDATVRKMVIVALGDIGAAADEAVPALQNLANDSDPVLRRRAVVALTEIGTGDAFLALEEFLEDNDEAIARLASQSLGIAMDQRKAA